MLHHRQQMAEMLAIMPAPPAENRPLVRRRIQLRFRQYASNLGSIFGLEFMQIGGDAAFDQLGKHFIDLGGNLNTVVAMLIAACKALLVILFFMHVRYSSRLTWVFVSAGFFWLMILLSLTLADVLSRHWLPT